MYVALCLYVLLVIKLVCYVNLSFFNSPSEVKKQPSALGSCSFMGSLFKVPLARGSDPYMMSFFFKVHLARGSCSFMGYIYFWLDSLTLGYLSLGYVGLCCLRLGCVELCCFKVCCVGFC